MGRLLCCLDGKMVRVRWMDSKGGAFWVKSLYRALQPVSIASLRRLFGILMCSPR